MSIPIHRRTSQRPPKKTDGFPSARLAAEQGIKIKNPKDYVVLIGDKILDGRRAVTIAPKLPDTLPAGAQLRYSPPKGASSVVSVVTDYGDTVRVTLADKSELVVERDHLAMIVTVNARPRLVHKRDLHKFFGDAIGRIFWDRVAGMRVPYVSPTSKPKVTRPKSNPPKP